MAIYIDFKWDLQFGADLCLSHASLVQTHVERHATQEFLPGPPSGEDLG